jgi:heptosyltransferase II
MSQLFVRLPNHLGDACMCVPALDLLAQRYELNLVGKPWARSLFEAYPWRVLSLSGGFIAQVDALRAERTVAGDVARGLLFTNSFGTALQFRLAGLKTFGYATDGRSLLLDPAIPRPARWASDMHTVEYYHALAQAAIAAPPAATGVPPELHLRVGDAARTRALDLLRNADVHSGYSVLCPVAIGRHRGRIKAWSGFAQLCKELIARGIRVLGMPGPGESEAVRDALPGATVLPTTDVSTFAAVLAASRLVVANDSGAGHVAAAVGARLVSVFGVTEPTRTRPWGTRCVRVGDQHGWPRYEEVLAAVDTALAR